MSDNCECEYCSDQGEPNYCWALKEIATLKAKVAELTTTNSRSTPCNCGNPSVVHFCHACLKTHDEYCKVPF